jgi:hypothetical protein
MHDSLEGRHVSLSSPLCNPFVKCLDRGVDARVGSRPKGNESCYGHHHLEDQTFRPYLWKVDDPYKTRLVKVEVNDVVT